MKTKPEYKPGIRYAILEVLPPKTGEKFARVTVAYKGLGMFSAVDVIKAWNYQLSQKGGWMEKVEDEEAAIKDRIADLKNFAFKR